MSERHSANRDLSPVAPPRIPRLSAAWEKAVFVHASVLVIGLSWWFGGQSPGARTALLVWGTLGIALFVFVSAAARSLPGRKETLRHLWPLLLFDALVILSCLNPSTRTVMREGEALLVHIDPRWTWLPSSARPDLSFRELWQFNGIVLSCYNVYLVLRRKNWLRMLLGVIAVNALALAVLGTFQKLSGATDLWFGTVPTPQKYFFSTFVYHNHWGAFTVLNVAACLALFFHYLRRGGFRDLWHSPAPLAALAIVFLATTAPLSGSRSTTLLLTLFLAGAVAHFLRNLIRRRRQHHESIAPPVVAVVVLCVLASAAVLFLSRDVVLTRAQTTAEQLAYLQSEDSVNTRLQLYRDTWTMAQEKPVFGWGLETYFDVFRIYNTQQSREIWFGQRVYQEAHNDWFQSLAEVGFVGTAFFVVLLLSSLVSVPWRRVHSPVPLYLLAGAGLILLYAWVEFPLASPSAMASLWLSIFVAARYANLDAAESQTPSE